MLNANTLLTKASDLRRSFDSDAIARDRAGGAPTEQIRLLKLSGLPSAQIPVAYGGQGASWQSVLSVVREFARTDGSLAHLYGYHHLPLNALLFAGSDSLKTQLLQRSAAENWVWGNSGNSLAKSSLGRKQGTGWVINGTRPFSSGSHIADYLQIAWEDDTGARHVAVIPPTRDGIIIENDWDGIGQRQTGSGTVTFREVQVREDELLGDFSALASPFTSLTSLFQQAVLLNIFLGSAIGALDAARDYTTEKSRPWVYSGYEKHTDDPFVQRTYGQLHIRVLAATELADQAAAELDAAYAQGLDLTAEKRGETAISLATANIYAGQIGLDASSEIFAVMGARSSSKANGFDRFWRNVRTHTLHNPAEYKKRTVGTWLLTGEYPTPGMYR